VVFTGRRYASMVYAVVVVSVRLYVCLSIRLSQAGIVQRPNAGSRTQSRKITLGLWCSEAKDLGEIPTGSPPTGAKI